MIGVIARPHDLAIAAEFFELFKTPWEPAVAGRRYRVMVSTEDRGEYLDADVCVLYGASQRVWDRRGDANVEQICGPVEVHSGGERFPIYTSVARFDRPDGAGPLTSGGYPIEYRRSCGYRTIWRVGYDLFAEVRHLLTTGQPVSQAQIPTLEHHIAVLRRLLGSSGVSFVEIPPRPDGFEFACCLTHDLDFFGIRRHTADRTLAGFVLRASIGTLADFLRGRRPLSEVLRNWVALCSLPAVLLGIAPDFWRPFDDYAKVEDGLPSTFFLVPFKGRPGVGPDGAVDATRAVAYEAADIRNEVSGAISRGSEVAVHGIDAWRDADAGRKEIAQLTAVTAQKRTGVRMHWLYFSDQSPRELEAAGFDYDSTWGYNDAVGYRPGTSQVFCIPGTRLMELPLSIMDSAMLFADRMGLAHEDALERCKEIVSNAVRFGGTVVINWHDRSLAPERQWGRSYSELLEHLQTKHQVWFGTASQAVDWFRWRRSVTFVSQTAGQVTVLSPRREPTLPPARVLVHRSTDGVTSVEEHALDGDSAMRFEL